jgi:hypothetical protein
MNVTAPPSIAPGIDEQGVNRGSDYPGHESDRVGIVTTGQAARRKPLSNFGDHVLEWQHD